VKAAPPSSDYRRIELREPAKIHEGLDALAWDVAGAARRAGGRVRGLLREAAAIDRISRQWAEATDAELRSRLFEIRARVRRRGSVDPLVLPEALALIREATHRTIGLRPYPVQLAGAIGLHRGWLCEMATGEGKTLTAALAGVLAGWTGHPCHVITVNDYLAGRDARWFQKLYAFCGVTVGHVLSSMDPGERQSQYDCDITYTTSKEVVADFLRDRLRLGRVAQPQRIALRQALARQPAGRIPLVGRSPHTAIVDEADSVLIDEAVTPLIICQPRSNASMEQAVQVASRIAEGLVEGRDYRVDTRYREIELLESAAPRITALAAELPGFWSGAARRRELIEVALTARHFYHRGQQYVVQDGKVVIVDEFTGRLMPNRTWREGLHQAVEASEGLAITNPTEILARLSFQRYFRLYRRLAGMTGTARESATELWRVYGLTVVAIPSNRPCRRTRLKTRYFAEGPDKFDAVVDEIIAMRQAGRPVLVGTRSVESSEALSTRLAEAGYPSHVLNAVRHAEEARIIEQAGESGRITIATNMAGRGTDIILRSGVAAAGGLHVISAEPNESARIDRQLYGRSGHQGNPGSARAFVCLQDALLRRFVPSPLLAVGAFLLRRGGARIGGWSAAALVIYAQRAAQRLAAVQRANVLRADKWLDEALAFSGKGNEG
jgi:preprotein translocase subunit SecA